MKNIIALLAAGLTASAASASGSSAAQFLKMGAGARAASMGNAYTAVADDVTAGYWNPAGLAQISSSEVALMHNEGLVDTKYEYAGAAAKMNKAAVALNIYSMNYGSIDAYDKNDVKAGSFDASSLAGALTYSSMANDNLYWGVNAKLIKESIEAESASGIAADFGLLYKMGATKLGFTAQNIGGKMKFVSEESSLPQLISAGVSRTLLDEKLLIAADVAKYNDSKTKFRAGLDYSVASVLSLRGGYEGGETMDLGGLTGVCGGVGLHFGNINIDYAFRPFGDLGDTHRVSLQIKFNRLNN
jgi:hypothetical protein